VQISLCFDGQVEQAMSSDLIKHVIEKTNSSANVRPADTI
jgi:hypothetical protein